MWRRSRWRWKHKKSSSQNFFGVLSNFDDSFTQVTTFADRPGYERTSSSLWKQREEYCASLIQKAWKVKPNIVLFIWLSSNLINLFCWRVFAQFQFPFSRCTKTEPQVPQWARWFSFLSNSVFIGPESDHWEGLSVTHSLTHSLTDWLLFSKLDWCDPGVWRCQLKTCWGCYCCWCW